VAVPIPQMNMLAQSISPAARAAGDVGRSEATMVKGAVAAPFEARAAATQAKNVSQSWQNAPQIEAAQTGVGLGLKWNPALLNISTPGKKMANLANVSKTNVEMSKANLDQVPIIAKREMGIPEHLPLTTEEPFNIARERISQPYEEVRQMPTLTPDPAVMATLDSLQPPKTIGGEAVAAKVAQITDQAKTEIASGVTGDTVVNTIQQNRRDAQAIYTAQKKGAVPPSPEQIAIADAHMGVADALESLIESNIINDPTLLGRFRDARTAMAKTYAYQKATDFNTGKMDPHVLADATGKNPNLQGVIADIGRFTGNFPELMGRPGPVAEASRASVLSGASVGAGMGYAVGLATGIPGAKYVGASLGAGAGTKLGEGISSLARGRVMSPEFQAANVPIDYRPPINNLRPVEPNVVTNGLVPYDYSQSVMQPGQRPNWIPGRPDAQVTTPGVQQGPAQLGAPSAQSTLQGVAGRRAFDYNMERALAEQQAQQEAAKATGARKTTGTGTPLVFDATTGKLVPAGETLRGATPDIQVIESTGKSLSSAARKMTSGTMFDLTAEERIAWDKTKVDLESISPEYKSLSSKEIANRMMDRDWVERTIAKAREKAAAFDELSKRADTAKARFDASVSREKMLDFLNDLEENMRPARKVSGTQQGPKTREFNANRLAQQSTNHLGQ